MNASSSVQDAANGHAAHDPSDDNGDRLRRCMSIPSDHVGEFVIPGTGRHIWWTGRVAIGLLYRRQHSEPTAQSSIWIQDLLLSTKTSPAARH